MVEKSSNLMKLNKFKAKKKNQAKRSTLTHCNKNAERQSQKFYRQQLHIRKPLRSTSDFSLKAMESEYNRMMYSIQEFYIQQNYLSKNEGEYNTSQNK